MITGLGTLMKENNKPRLLYFVEAMGGGVFTYIVDLANSLVDDWDVYIGYAVRNQTPQNYREYFDERVHLIEVKDFARSTSITRAIKAGKEMKMIAGAIRPDVIHLHSSIAGAIGRVVFNTKKTPVFYTPHGYSFLMQGESSKKRLAYKLVEQFCGKSQATTIACSSGEYQEALKVSKHAVEVDNGINIEQLQELIDTTDASKIDHYDVFTLGRISVQKNPNVFNEVALKLPNLKFLWIGDGELRSELTAPNITVTGWLTRHEALKYSLNSDTFMLTSLWEGLPMSLLEAMYMKKLCVVSDVIGNHDVITDGVNGYVCKKVSDYYNKIKAADEDYRQTLVNHAYEDVVGFYNTEKMSEAYSQLYRAAINDHS
ncbi:glycosyltransferase [Lactobacillus delbrueckii subsp. bulgaricus]|nr:glycosyltransferase [Lactobacillus delbrueckii subsp. bulgaricus]MCT3518434.1 glycosyltransferase [Lactobacillus delbrueckii subsp. bulgaricus]